MVGCCAYGCSNSKRLNPNLMFHKFPADPKQKMEWVVRVCRADEDGNLWLPRQHRLCSAHFAKECYMTRMCDKRQILKPGAIPTIFSHLKSTDLPTSMVPKLGKPAQQDEGASKLSDSEQQGVESDQPALESDQLVTKSDHTYSTEYREPGDRPRLVDKSTQIFKGHEELKTCRRQLEQMKRLYEKEKTLNQRLLSSLEKLFTSDQLDALKRVSPKGMPWGEETIRKAIHTRLVCGRAGYEMLVQQGYPLPCMRTLHRRLQNTPGVVPTLFDGPKAPDNVSSNELRIEPDELEDLGGESDGDIVDDTGAVIVTTEDEQSELLQEISADEDVESERQPEIVMYLPQSAGCDFTPT